MDYTQCTPTPRKNKHLSLTEWIKIEIMLQEGKTAYAIAKSLQRSINTILHEIRCGSVDQIKAGKKIRIYLADAGQVLRFYEFYISRRYIKKGSCGLQEQNTFIRFSEAFKKCLCLQQLSDEQPKIRFHNTDRICRWDFYRSRVSTQLLFFYATERLRRYCTGLIHPNFSLILSSFLFLQIYLTFSMFCSAPSSWVSIYHQGSLMLNPEIVE